MKFLNLSFFIRGAMAVFAFLLASNLSSAQILTITNNTGCEKVIEVFTFQSCIPATANPCGTFITVPAGTSALGYNLLMLYGCSGSIGHVNVFPGSNCGMSAPLPMISMGIPGCVCTSGTTSASGSYMNGGTTINATTGCTGGGNATLVIW